MPTPPTDPDRLHGWKEISAFVGKGTRTVQRWEKQYGLPVRRLGKDGEIVFASKREIEAWLERTSHPHGNRYAGSESASDAAEDGEAEAPTGDRGLVGPGPPRRASITPLQWSFGVAAVACFVVVVIGVRWLSSGPSRGNALGRAGMASATIDHCEVDGRFLRAFGRDGREQWTRDFKEDIGAGAYAGARSRKMIVVNDIDEDGKSEVFFVFHGANTYPRNTQLAAIDSDGKTRFTYAPSYTARFGDESYVPPWVVSSTQVTLDANGKKSLWVVSIHAPNFPSIIERLDPESGAVLSSYWSNGYIDGVWSVTWRGRPALAVGATNNDFRAASVAIFPADAVTGAAPANRRPYRCQTCPPGAPEEFLIFPRSCILAARGGQPNIQQLTTDSTGALLVSVAQGDDQGLVYWLTPDLQLARMDASQEFEATHERLRLTGIVDHAFGVADEASLEPILRWDGVRFAPLNKVSLAR